MAKTYIIDGVPTVTDRPFRFDGVELPTPDKYQCGEEDMSSSKTGRTLDAKMHKDVVAVKDYYTLTWESLSWETAAQILSAVRGKSQGRFTYADPSIPRQFITGDFYVGKRSTEAVNLSTALNNFGNLTMQFTRI